MTHKPTITFLIGVAGSGKSTWAATQASETTAVVSRDAIRKALFTLSDWDTVDYHAQPKKSLALKESLVTDTQLGMIRACLKNGVSVIVDNTNLKMRYINHIRKEFQTVPHKYKIFDITLEEVLSRNRSRLVHRTPINPTPTPVEQPQQMQHLQPQGWIAWLTVNILALLGLSWMPVNAPSTSPSQQLSSSPAVESRQQVEDSVVIKQYSDFKTITKTLAKDWLKEFSPVGEIKAIVQDATLPQVYIFDLDGTLAHHDQRGIFEFAKADTDTLDPIVHQVFQAVSAQLPIIICSGRGSEGLQATQKWLAQHKLDHLELHLRRPKDSRADYLVKEDMWRDISTRYNIVAMFDDRNQVVNHARALGFKVFQVAEGDF